MNVQEGWPERLTRLIAGRIRQQRKARKWSAQRLSDECAALGLNIPRSTIADLENGRRHSVSVAELLVLAQALGVAPDVLLVSPDGDKSPGPHLELTLGTLQAPPDAPTEPDHAALRAAADMADRIGQLLAADGDRALAVRQVDRALRRVQIEVEELLEDTSGTGKETG